MSGTKYIPEWCHDAERAASEEARTLCPECGRAPTQEHAGDCVLRPVLRYEDHLRFLKANHPEEYWGKYVEYLSDP